jgi:HlyD family secretion protein
MPTSPMDLPRNRSGKRRVYLVVVGAIVIAIMTTAFGFHIEAGGPTVARRSLRTAVVQRGTLDRSVGSPGTLVPERIRWITATSPARVERIEVRPGAEVDEHTVLLRLRNPDLELEALQASSELAAAKAELANLTASLETERLGQEATVASIRSERSEAARIAAANERLVSMGSVSGDEVARSRERDDELGTRLSLEQRRLRVLSKARVAQIDAHRARVSRLEAVAQFRERQLEELEVTGGETGVLQELAVEVGQWVEPGTLLAKVARPDRLQAELRVPEVRAKDLRVGQRARVDTHNGVMEGHVARIDPGVTGGIVKVDVSLTGALPTGARPDLSVDGVIELEQLHDVLWIKRPARAEPGSVAALFVVGPGGAAVRTPVKFGRASVDAIEVIEGLHEGDEVIVSDTTSWDDAERISVER